MSTLSIILIGACAVCAVNAFRKDSKAWGLGFVVLLSALALRITGNL